ncbi:MAG: hypothetical protein IMZ53_09470, partial [Thermoplasmata archaeon]|nr:hypothetical protein [Thermoplasmata archaeon]
SPFKPIPKGTYSFEVLEASDETSSKGNDMIKVNLAIWQGERVLCRVFDYLLAAMEAKLRHACDSCGLLDKYQQGSLQASDFIGRTGSVKIKIKKATSEYPEKNEVEDYVCRPAKALRAQEPDDELLPF